MGDVEAAADLVTGGLVAGAIERESRTRASGEGHNPICLNCGTALLGAFCHRCGQPEHIHRSLFAVWHDLAHGVLHLEGKIWNTLPLLAWRPGDLTRRFIHGERARFVSPIALFLFSVFLMFALFSAFGLHLGLEENAAVSAEQAKKVASFETSLAELDTRIARAKAKGQDTSELERERRASEAIGGLLVRPAGGKARPKLDFRTGIPPLDKAIAKANENPNLLLYKIQSNAYKFSWLLIPISTPLLWLLFAWRRQYRVYDHAVFVTYSLAFMSLLAIVLTALAWTPLAGPWLVAAAVFVPPLHMYRQMRGAYRLGRLNAAVRTILLIFFAQIALLTFVLALIALGAFG